jgi:hypothetical protein
MEAFRFTLQPLNRIGTGVTFFSARSFFDFILSSSSRFQKLVIQLIEPQITTEQLLRAG